ncbi:hypothetical protein K7X08_035111 [Anisodus acutangulus]|uniref:Uncharacterized protein n=1 Tax=Anisodus acutangulus TaxID=402998 RepID=A0A9Q1LI58_9SOLA|nr:hypothetical protein K7X08_035111 [Anisodus acutangulus]
MYVAYKLQLRQSGVELLATAQEYAVHDPLISSIQSSELAGDLLCHCWGFINLRCNLKNHLWILLSSALSFIKLVAFGVPEVFCR